MKHIVLLCDGMADYPLELLGGKTPMSLANKPHMDYLAQHACVGLVQTVAHGFAPGSDVANLSVMGYDPKLYYTGRSPLEAASIGIAMKPDDVALRCNLVTLSEGETFSEKTILDYCADDISTAEAEELVSTLKQEFDNEVFTYYSGVSYRHCLIWHGGTTELGGLVPPHDITGKLIKEYLPAHPSATPLLAMMEKSYDILLNHPVNRARAAKGLRPANAVWLWGEGRSAALPSFQEVNGLSGAVISAVDLIKGIGKLAGMQVVEVPGATGYIDTNFSGKAESAVQVLEDGTDFIYLHVEAPDECGHRFEIDNKIRAIELIDEKVLAPILSYLDKTGEDYKIMVLPDHATPLELKTHVCDPVPFFIYQKSKEDVSSGVSVFDEAHAKETKIFEDDGAKLLGKMIAW